MDMENRPYVFWGDSNLLRRFLFFPINREKKMTLQYLNDIFNNLNILYEKDYLFAFKCDVGYLYPVWYSSNTLYILED